MLLLTAQRREKVTTMRWDDVIDGVWTIRAEEREKGAPGELKLPQLALEVIAAQPRIRAILTFSRAVCVGGVRRRARRSKTCQLDRRHSTVSASARPNWTGS